MVKQDQGRRSQRWFIDNQGLDRMVRSLMGQGYQVIAPRVRDGVIAFRPITDADQIAHGVRDEQDGGHYRLTEADSSEDDHLPFEYVVGPEGPKRYLFPPRQQLFKMHVSENRFVLDEGAPPPPKLALLGVRPCELAAIAVQDRVFDAERGSKPFACESETYYRQVREQAVLIAVNCTRPGGTCFCASWGTGPETTDHHPFDLSLTPLRGGFVARVGSPRGQSLLEELGARPPSAAEIDLEELKLTRARDHMGRRLDTDGVRELLRDNVDHPHWDQVAKRCLSCGNCTMVCPTCFCSTVVDSNELSAHEAAPASAPGAAPGGAAVTRTRQWESCFTHQFSYTTAGPVRNTIRGRYRHWLRHKVSTWHEQFGCGGCVGCGRCITWCPVGIDLTQEIEAIRQDHAQASRPGAGPGRAGGALAGGRP
ncbi:MAG: 4Fe-4S dicluster domain-containing protein [Phycisphaeraceae bacterium]|nr:4Fe-4S dicluster domain-containing protein [Phycisphaeraceae bacterium]